MPDEDHGLRVTIADGRGRRVRVPGLATWLTRVAPGTARGAVTLALVGDRRIRALNRAYRGVDAVTDVLSFGADGGRRPDGPPRALGDVVIAKGVAARQAREAGHSLPTEYRVLALHGLLHLLGYDHERDDGRMARLERTLRRRGGLAHGLIARARRQRRPAGKARRG
jgi:probable rRNA maturation factor